MSLLFLTILGPLLSIAYCSNKDLCPTRTKLFQHKDGAIECLVCSHCPRGKVKVANCSVDSDTICEPCDDYSYYDDKEPHCRPCTGCPPGEFIKSPCSQFLDNDCEPCPNGTFSSSPNSSSCTNCSVCTDGHYTECNKTHNAICNQTDTLSGGKEESEAAGIYVGVAIGVTVAVVIGLIIVSKYMYRQRRSCCSKHTKGYETTQQGDPEEADRDHIHRKKAKEETELSTVVIREPVPANDKRVLKHTKLELIKIKELREKQMEREDDIKKLEEYEQLPQLYSSVGEFFGSKPIVESSSKLKQDNRKLAVCFVGSKYIMTTYFPVRDICGTTENGDLNYARFDDRDVYVAFDGTNTSKMKFKIRSSTPAYTNTLLDIIVLEIYPSFGTATIETENGMSLSTSSSTETKDSEGSSHFPPPFCLHTSLPIDDVHDINLILFDRNSGRKVQSRSNIIKQLNEPLHQAYNYLSDNDDTLIEILKKSEKNEDFLFHSIRDLTNVGKTKFCWITFKSEACFGSPGIIFDGRDNCCRLLCICNGKVPKIMDDLPLEHQQQLQQVKNVRIGTLVSEVYKDIKKNNPTLAEELFYEFDDDQKVQ